MRPNHGFRRPSPGLQLMLRVADDAGLELARTQNAELVHTGDDHFDRVVAAVGGAQTEVCLEMYQIRPDAVGLGSCEALARAAERGVHVRLLADPVGCAKARDQVWALRDRGVDLRWYNPLRPWNHPLKRTHRKLLVVDGRVASIGGINLAAEFSRRVHDDQAWRDVGFWFEGPAASRFRDQFEGAWAANGGAPGVPMPRSEGTGPLCAIAGGTQGRTGHAEAYLSILRNAQREVLLATPYFIPDRELRDALVGAVSRGVRVVVVVPRLSDIGWFKHAGRRLYHRLLTAGVEIRERCDRMVHAKVGTVDGLVAVLGSTNLNRQSFYGNAETLLLTHEQSIVHQVHDLVMDEAAHATEILHSPEWIRHPDRRRLAEFAATPVSLIF
jgi:cardiolipin synthase